MISLPLVRFGLERCNCCSVVGFVGLATVALAAELRGLVAVCGAAAGVVRSVDEEHGGVEAAGQAGVCAIGDLDHVHQVLVVAGGTNHYGNRSRTDSTHCGTLVGGGLRKESVVGDEFAGVGAVHGDGAGGRALGAIPVVLAAAAYLRVHAHRVILQVASRATSSRGDAKQRGYLIKGSVGAGKGLIDLILHHGAFSVVAVVAAEAGEQAIHVGRSSGHAGGQGLSVASAAGYSAEGKGLTVEAGHILAPEDGLSGGEVGSFGSAVAVCAVVGCMASRTAAAVVEVGAEYVRCGRRAGLGSRESSGSQDQEGD